MTTADSITRRPRGPGQRASMNGLFFRSDVPGFRVEPEDEIPGFRVIPPVVPPGFNLYATSGKERAWPDGTQP